MKAKKREGGLSSLAQKEEEEEFTREREKKFFPENFYSSFLFLPLFLLEEGRRGGKAYLKLFLSFRTFASFSLPSSSPWRSLPPFLITSPGTSLPTVMKRKREGRKEKKRQNEINKWNFFLFFLLDRRKNWEVAKLVIFYGRNGATFFVPPPPQKKLFFLGNYAITPDDKKCFLFATLPREREKDIPPLPPPSLPLSIGSKFSWCVNLNHPSTIQTSKETGTAGEEVLLPSREKFSKPLSSRGGGKKKDTFFFLKKRRWPFLSPKRFPKLPFRFLTRGLGTARFFLLTLFLKKELLRSITCYKHYVHASVTRCHQVCCQMCLMREIPNNSFLASPKFLFLSFPQRLFYVAVSTFFK